MDRSNQSYLRFASLQAILAATAVFGLFVAYRLRPDLSRSASASFACLMLAVLLVGYYLSIHQILKRHWARPSSMVVAILAAINIWLAIWQTGGLSSPYLALWVLYLASLGLLGWLAPLAATVVTLAIFTISLFMHPDALGSHLAQLLVVVAAGAIAIWVSTRQPANATATDRVSVPSQPLDIRLLMQSLGEGVVVVDAQRRIQYLNQAGKTMTGWADDQAQSLDYRTVLKLQTASGQVVSDNIDPFVKAWRQGTTAISTDLTITTQGGRRFATTMTVSPIYDTKGQPTGGIALFRDITAEKAIERQRNEFISTASHEMRTPIAAIEGYLALALNPTTSTVDDRAKGYLTKAHENIGHLGELFKNLLVITKIEDKSLSDKIENVNLSELLQKAVEDMQIVAQQKELSVDLTSGSQLVASANPVMPIFMVKANPERLREVIMNLIENAIKYTQAGRVTVSLTGDNDTVSVGVTDTGMGIPADDLPHLFQKFYRVDNSATRTIGGTGLGLYICRTIVELYGGHIEVKSTVGEGSTFTFHLPRLKVVSTQPEGTPGSIVQPAATSPKLDGVKAPA